MKFTSLIHNKPFRPLSLMAILMLSASLSMAGTIVKIKTKDEVSTILTDGKQARMNMNGDEYIIVNYSDSSVRMVNPAKHQVMLLNINDMPKGDNSPKIKTAIKKLGKGPKVAGYKTNKFSYTVNGKSCGIIYGSKSAYELNGIKDLFNALRTMAESQRSMMGGFAGMIDACTLGDIEMSRHVSTTGIPMRTEERGVVDTEIKSIKVDVTIPANTFVIPASYKTVTLNEQIKQAKKDMTKMQQQYQPQMDQMMQQMQQSGQMSPQAMEQMKRVQEMMKQYQQQ